MNTVEFPHWGLEFPLPTVAFKVFGIPIYWYGIIIAAGFLLAVLLGMKDSKNHGIEQESVIDMVLWGAPIAVIFARIYYVVFSWSEFKDNPIEVFYIRNGGLAIFGGLIGALLTGYIFARYKKIRPLKLFDFVIPFVALGQAIGRWGNFVNQEAFGVNTKLPWGMTSDTVRNYLAFEQENLAAKGITVDPYLPVHPTFLYESLWDLAIFFILFKFAKKKKIEGEVFFLYLILYGAGRVWIEGLRTDSLMIGNLRVSQLVAALLLIVFSVVFFTRRKKLNDVELANTTTGHSIYGEILKDLEKTESVCDNTAINAEGEKVNEVAKENETDGEIEETDQELVDDKEEGK